MTRPTFPEPDVTFDMEVETGTRGLVRAGIAFALAVWIAFFLLPVGAKAAPTGYPAWCARDAANCPDVSPVTLVYSNDLYFMMREVHWDVSGNITYTAEQPGYDDWRCPVDKRGDCEDIAICILLGLIEKGVPRGAIRFAASRDHAWVEVMTDKGPIGIDAYDIDTREDFRATATRRETYDCDPIRGCLWRSNTLLPETRVVTNTQDRSR